MIEATSDQQPGLDLPEEHVNERAASPLRRLWDLAADWKLVRGIGNSRVAAASTLTPFIGYAILYHDKAKDFLGDLATSVGSLVATPAVNLCGSYLHFAMRLNLIYISCLLVGGGTMLYRICAPRVVQVFSDSDDFVERTLDQKSFNNMRYMLREIKRIDDRIHGSNSFRRRLEDRYGTVHVQWVRGELEAGSANTKKLDGDLQRSIKISIMKQFYEYSHRRVRQNAARIVLFLFAVGTCLLLLPGLDTTRQVIFVIMRAC